MNGEWLVILVVALLVFGPRKLAHAAYHAGRVVNKLRTYQYAATQFWHKEMTEYDLLDRQRQAQAADEEYTRLT